MQDSVVGSIMSLWHMGQLRLVYIFWREDDLVGFPALVPALLIYADLIGSGIERNIQIANEILENDLQYLK